MRAGRLLLATAIVATACSDQRRVTDVPARLYSSGALDSLPRLELAEVAPVCPADGIDCEVDVGAVAVDDSGAVAFAGVFRDRQIRLVDATTRIARVIGRSGSGPGEYQTVVALGFSPAGTIRAFDVMQHRILEYARDGRVLSTSIVPVPSGFVVAGFVRGELRIIATDAATRSGDSTSVAMFAADSGQHRPRRLFDLGVRQRSYRIGDLIPIKPPFEASPRYAIRPDGSVLYSPGSDFRIDLIDSTGARLDRFGFDVSPRPVTTRDLEHWQARAVRGLPADMQAAIRGSAAGPAPHHPAITQLNAINDGLWVREAAQGDSAGWIRFDRDGTPNGTVVLGEDAAIVGGYDRTIIISEPTTQKGRRSLRWFTATYRRTAAVP